MQAAFLTACSTELTPSPPLAAVFGDVLWCLGLGLFLGMGRDVLGLTLGNGRLRCFVWDILSFTLAAVLVCGFAAAVSASGTVRWYMALAMAAGALAWAWGASGVVHRMAGAALAGATFPLRIFTHKVLRPLGGRLRKAKECRREKKNARKADKKAKNSKKVLQKPKRVLYN